MLNPQLQFSNTLLEHILHHILVLYVFLLHYHFLLGFQQFLFQIIFLIRQLFNFLQFLLDLLDPIAPDSSWQSRLQSLQIIMERQAVQIGFQFLYIFLDIYQALFQNFDLLFVCVDILEV